jgi:hypothetical protein
MANGGPSFDGRSWLRSRHPDQPWRRQPYLVDNGLLNERFGDKFVAGLKRLQRDGKLKLGGEWSHLQEPEAFAAWLKTFSEGAWVVYIEPPPENSRCGYRKFRRIIHARAHANDSPTFLPRARRFPATSTRKSGTTQSPRTGSAASPKLPQTFMSW